MCICVILSFYLSLFFSRKHTSTGTGCRLLTFLSMFLSFFYPFILISLLLSFFCLVIHALTGKSAVHPMSSSATCHGSRCICLYAFLSFFLTFSCMRAQELDAKLWACCFVCCFLSLGLQFCPVPTGLILCHTIYKKCMSQPNSRAFCLWSW